MLKIFFGSLFLLSLSNVLAQNNDFIIYGETKGYEENTIVKLKDTENNKWVDSVRISNQRFKLTYHQPKYEHPSQYFLFVGNKKDIIPIFIGNTDTLKLSFDFESFPNHKIIQSENQREYEQLDSIFYFPTTEILKNIFTIKALKELDADGAAKNATQFEYLIESEREKVNNQILNYENNFIALYYLANYINILQPERKIMENFYNSLTPWNKENKYAKAIFHYINQDNGYLNDEMYNLNSEKVYLLDIPYKNYLLLDIASFYCGFSAEAKPSLEKVVNKYADKLDVFSIHVDNDLEGLKDYSVKGHPNWKFFYNPEGRFGNFYIKYKVIGTPSYYLFDNDGNLISSWINDGDLETKIKSLIE